MLGDPWLIVSIVLTAIAVDVLAWLVLPRQARILADLARADVPSALPERGRRTTRLAMRPGVFNLLWAVVTVLMVIRPGATT